MIGTELAGRYDIINRVGGGGMAIVYMGVDQLLNRKVAVKVLRQQYVHDEEFIQRFRREAQSAASLSHPNVVSIYDVGQEEDIHYIVMEYVEGTTLNEIIKERAPLQVEEAIHYATQICDALDHAHHNQIIHRDIKPHNILIGKNGRVKVTDFGIARAVTASTITQTGSVVGSVHYFSPEHAKGISTGAKSDIYSLGIVLYQMLTGKLPFLGESPISVALKHLQEDVEEPRKVNPLIPQSVENIILKAMRKNQDERYTSAEEMVVDLETCLIPERLHEPKIVFGEDKDWDEDWEEEQTRVLPAIRDVRSESRSDSKSESRLESRTASRNGGHSNDREKGDEAPRVKKYFWVKSTVWLILLSAIAVSMWYVVDWVKENIVVADVPVPYVVGRTLNEATEQLEKAKLYTNIIPEFNDEFEKDTIFKQYPEKMDVKVHSTVDLYVSLGVDLKNMPGLKGQNIAAAKEQLKRDFNLKEELQIEVAEEFDDEIPAGIVISQEPVPNAEFDPKKVHVFLTVSKGRNVVKMPDLVNDTLAEAKKKLDELGLVLLDRSATQESSYQIEKGKIMMQFPYGPDMDVPVGTEIEVVLSSGLPADAGPMTLSIPIAPSVPGQETMMKIIITDAKHDRHTYSTFTISESRMVDVDIIVSPEKNASINILRVNADGKDETVEILTKTYSDYLALKSLMNGL